MTDDLHDQLKLLVRQAIIRKGYIVREDANTFGWADYEATTKQTRHHAANAVGINDPIDDAEWSEFLDTDVDNKQCYGIEVRVRVDGRDQTWRYAGPMGALLTEILR